MFVALLHHGARKYLFVGTGASWHCRGQARKPHRAGTDSSARRPRPCLIWPVRCRCLRRWRAYLRQNNERLGSIPAISWRHASGAWAAAFGGPEREGILCAGCRLPQGAHTAFVKGEGFESQRVRMAGLTGSFFLSQRAPFAKRGCALRVVRACVRACPRAYCAYMSLSEVVPRAIIKTCKKNIRAHAADMCSTAHAGTSFEHHCLPSATVPGCTGASVPPWTGGGPLTGAPRVSIFLLHAAVPVQNCAW